MEIKQDTVKIRAAQCPICGAQYPASYHECPYCGGVPLQTNHHKAKGGKRVQHGGKRAAPGGWDEADIYDAEMEREAPAKSRPKPTARPEAARRPAPMFVEPEAPTPRRRIWLVIRIILRVLSLLIIAAAIYIVTTKAIPFVQQLQGQKSGQQQTEQQTQNQGDGQEDGQADEGAAVPTGGEDAASVVTLTENDVTLDSAGQTHALVAELTPLDPEAVLTWTSSNPTVVAVNDQGVVTAVSNGTSNITASLPNGASAICLVRCNWSVNTTRTRLSLNRDDFTLFSKGETFTMKVVGTTKDVSWASADESIVTVTPGGVVTAQSEGVTVVTAQVDGETLTCTVRCRFS